MKSSFFSAILVCLVACNVVCAQDIDTELSTLAANLTTQIKDQGKKKVAVNEFMDLQGNSSELGKYVAEQLTVDLVMNKREFSVLDRANLKNILAEHKLTAKGLIDPDTAKKIGMFAGVDALILGTITPKGGNINLTAKIITTDTAEIVGAAKASFKADDTVQQLESKPATESGGATAEDKPSVVKSLGDLRVAVQSLRVTDGDYVLTVLLTDQNPNKSIWVALNSDTGGALTDAGGNEFRTKIYTVTGIKAGRQLKSYYGNADDSNNRFDSPTEIKPGDSISATVRFVSFSFKRAAAGVCDLQLEFLLGHNFDKNAVTVSTQNLITKVTAQ